MRMVRLLCKTVTLLQIVGVESTSVDGHQGVTVFEKHFLVTPSSGLWGLGFRVLLKLKPHL